MHHPINVASLNNWRSAFLEDNAELELIYAWGKTEDKLRASFESCADSVNYGINAGASQLQKKYVDS